MYQSLYQFMGCLHIFQFENHNKRWRQNQIQRRRWQFYQITGIPRIFQKFEKSMDSFIGTWFWLNIPTAHRKVSDFVIQFLPLFVITE